MNGESIKQYFKKSNLSNSVGHAFLFCNATYEDFEKEIEEIINELFFEEGIEIINNPNVYVITPEKNVIKKEIIKELENNLSTTSQEFESKVYIIKECEKLNGFSANSLLKTLEEPKGNIYAFLFTKNINKVIPTIKSRCQIIQMANSKETDIVSEYGNELVESTLSLINQFEQKKDKLMAYDLSIYKEADKEKLKNEIFIMIKFYMDCLNNIIGKKLEYFINYTKELEETIKGKDIRYFTKKIILLNKYSELLEYNLNINLFLDKMIIELGRI